MKRVLFICPVFTVIFSILSINGFGQLLVDDFNYTGNLSANGWVAHSGTATNPIATITPGLTYTGFPGDNIGNAAQVKNTSGEDVNKRFSSQNTNGQSIYFSFLVNVNESTTSKSGDYFIHIGNNSSVDGTTFTNFAARVFARVVSSNVNFGLSNTATATYGTTNFSKNTTYLLVVKYTINTGGNDATSLYVFASGVPASEAAAGTPEVTNTTTTGVDIINAVALRQGTTSQPQEIVDGIRVGLGFSQVTNVSNPTDQFRSITNGVWSSSFTWESSPDDFTTIVSPATLSPDFNANIITIQNTDTVTLNDQRTIDQTNINSGGALNIDPSTSLTLNNGSGDDISIALGGSLVIQSTSNGTARIADLSNGATISGSVTVERYISSLNNRAYRLLAPSVNSTGAGSIHNNWQEGVTSNIENPFPGFGTHITGTTNDQDNGFDGTQSGQPSLFLYNQTVTPQTWNAINNTSTNLFNAKTGYLLFVRGNRSVNLTSTANPLPSSNTTLRARGTLLTQNQTFTGLETNGRFSLVTNPYASPINWNSIYTDGTTSNSTNFENYYTYWDPNISTRGAYVTVTADGVNSAGTNATVEIQQGQAFFIKTKSGITGPPGPTFTVKESHKSSTANIDVFRVGNPESFRMRLFYDDNGTRQLADGVIGLFNNDFSIAVDRNDAEKLSNFDENIAIAREGKMLSIEGRPLIETNDIIPLSIARLKVQQYEWQFDPSNFAHPNLQAYFQDKFLNTQTPISLTTTTTIAFNVTADAASSAADRFTVVFAPSVALPISMTSVKAYQKSTGIQVEWNVLNELNIDKYEIEKSLNGTDFVPATSVAATGNNASSRTYNWYDANPNAGNNFYRIRSVSKTGATVYSEIVRISLGKGAFVLSVYPNPVVEQMIGLQLTNLEKGKYFINLTNQLGQQILAKVLEHGGGSISQTLQPGSAFVKGIYQLQIKGEHANITQQVVKQ